MAGGSSFAAILRQSRWDHLPCESTGLCLFMHGRQAVLPLQFGHPAGGAVRGLGDQLGLVRSSTTKLQYDTALSAIDITKSDMKLLLNQCNYNIGNNEVTIRHSIIIN